MPSELENLRLQLAGFARFTTRALVESNLDALLLDACIRARAATRVSHAKVLEYLPAEDRLLLRAGIGWKPGYVGVYTAPADMDTAIGYAFNLCGLCRSRTTKPSLNSGGRTSSRIMAVSAA